MAQRVARTWLPLSPLRAAALCGVLVGACGEDAPTSDGPEEPQPQAAPAAEPEIALSDIRPPEFEGVTEVALVGLDLFRIRWDAAVDDTSPPEAIRYRVYHVVEPYRSLADDTPPIYTSEPGVTEVTLANASDPGRFYVRAVDEAGNVSRVTPGLLQRGARPFVRASDGTLAAPITDCARRDDLLLCVGEEGFAAIWEGDGWRSLDLGVVVPLRLADTASGLFAYSALGHLFAFDETGKPELVELQFPLRAPELPFRQFTADALGLRYWIDDSGRTFVGAHAQFVPMTRPIGVPGEECRRLRGLAFGDNGNFAFCDSGAAYSSDPTTPGALWISLTPTADFELPHGVDSVLADDDSEGILVEPSGARRVGVGGWSAVLLADWNEPGVHPMDLPDDPIAFETLRDLVLEDGQLLAATDVGLLADEGDAWELVEDTEGPVAAAVPSDGPLTLVYEDGGVAELRRGEPRWLVQADVSGFTSALTPVASENGAPPLAIVPEDEREVLYRWDGTRWRRHAVLPEGAVGVAGPVEALVAYGANDAGEGLIWVASGDRFERDEWRYPAPVEPVEEDDADEAAGMVFDDPAAWQATPPPALTSVEADDADAPVPTPEPILYVDVTDDGRAVAVSAHQVWWRVGDGWRFMGTRPGTLSAAFVDAGESYVLIEDGAGIRCWREVCGEGVAPLAGAPTGARAVPGLPGVVIAADDQAYRFTPAAAPDEVLIEPALELPVGSFTAIASLGEHAQGLRSLAVIEGGAAILTERGELFEREGAVWELQGERPEAVALLAVEDTWAILTPRGLFRLGDVQPARRESPAP